jgi:predicted nucleic acid-binding Zn ribbon protein
MLAFRRKRNAARAPGKMTARERVLAQWRGVDLTAVEKSRALGGAHVSVLMPGLLKELRLDRRQSEAEITKVWNHLLDPNIVAHAQPIGLNKGTLFVAVDSSVWLSEIVRYRRKEILERLQHSFGRDLVTKISFRIG